MEPAPAGHERSRELADLRRRAYGPDADIQRDPDALRRLHDLEESARPMLAAEPGEAEPGEAAEDPASVIASLVAAPSTRSEPAADSTAPAAGRLPRWRGRAGWVIVGIGVVLTLVAGGAALLLSAAGPADGPDLTLAVVEDGDGGGSGWSRSVSNWGVEPSTLVQYEPYDSIDVWAGSTARGARCVLLSTHDRIFTAACAGQGLDPVLDLYGDDRWPVLLEEPLPPGGVIRFIARPTGVDVWVRPGTPSLPGFSR